MRYISSAVGVCVVVSKVISSFVVDLNGAHEGLHLHCSMCRDVGLRAKMVVKTTDCLFCSQKSGS